MQNSDIENGFLSASLLADFTAKKRKGAGGAKTGILALDNLLGGMEGGGLYVVAGRPGMGKSAFAMTVAQNMCQSGARVIFFSLKMSAKLLGHDQLCPHTLRGAASTGHNKWFALKNFPAIIIPGARPASRNPALSQERPPMKLKGSFERGAKWLNFQHCRYLQMPIWLTPVI